MASSQRTETNGRWTAAEHERFLQAMTTYPRGPWRAITEFIGTRSIKQVQTHAQKYQQKLLRHKRGLHKRKMKAVLPEHRIDSSTASQFTEGCIVRKTYRPSVLPSYPLPVPPGLSSEVMSICFYQASSAQVDSGLAPCYAHAPSFDGRCSSHQDDWMSYGCYTFSHSNTQGSMSLHPSPSTEVSVLEEAEALKLLEALLF